MEITYLGHSSFKIKGNTGTLVTDPFSNYIGFNFPSASADIITVSHDHQDHNNVGAVAGTARREVPLVINHPGEYEAGGISVFGVKTFHDAHGGVERGENIVFSFLVDDVKVCHLGDLGHELTSEQLAEIGSIDVLICPVGGAMTLDLSQAIKMMKVLEPSYVIPMHYKTPKHNADVFGDLHSLEDFLKEYGATDAVPLAKLTISKDRLPEETELVVLVS